VFVIEKLNDKHLEFLKGFKNQVKELEDFLKEDAFSNQKLKISTTYLLFHEDKEQRYLAGYVTLLADSIRIYKDRALKQFFENKGVEYNSLPAIKIGRIAVDKRLQKRGYGKNLIKFSMYTALNLSESIGCRFLTVDAKLNAKSFYKKHGFKVLIKRDKTTIMYLDLYLGNKDI